MFCFCREFSNLCYDDYILCLPGQMNNLFLIVTFSSSYLGFTFLNIILRSPCQTCLGCSHYTGIAFAPARKPSWIRRLLFTHKDSDFGDFCTGAKLPHAALKWRVTCRTGRHLHDKLSAIANVNIA